MSHADLLARLLPPVAYDPNAPRLASELSVEGMSLDRVQTSAASVHTGMFPSTAGDLITDWERVCGLTPTGTYQERIAAVRAKLVELGGLSIPYFIALAKRLGYTISIEEPQPFRVGTSRMGDRLAPWPDVLWWWRVTIQNSNASVWYFRMGSSRMGERLMSFGDAVIESVFNELKPAHTHCSFIYVADSERITESGDVRLTESGEPRIVTF